MWSIGLWKYYCHMGFLSCTHHLLELQVCRVSAIQLHIYHLGQISFCQHLSRRWSTKATMVDDTKETRLDLSTTTARLRLKSAKNKKRWTFPHKATLRPNGGLARSCWQPSPWNLDRYLGRRSEHKPPPVSFTPSSPPPPFPVALRQEVNECVLSSWVRKHQRLWNHLLMSSLYVSFPV